MFTIISGIALISGIFFLFTLLTTPSVENLERKTRDKAKKIYNKCEELKIKIDEPEQEETLLIVAALFNVTDIKIAKELYALGEKLINEERQEKKK